MKYGVKVVGTASYLPEKILTNYELEKIVDTSDEWITQRTGIKERRIADGNIASSDLATEAAKILLKETNTNPLEIDGIIVGTLSPDMLFPSTACFLQKNIQAKNAFAFDILAACSGFIYGLALAKSLIETGQAKKILLVGSDVSSKFVNWQDRNTCILFGDGAGVMLLEKTEENNTGILSVCLYAEGKEEILNLPGGGSRFPASEETIKNKLHYMHMQGREVFKFAVIKMIESLKKALEICNKNIDDLALIIPHQANIRIIDAMVEKLKIPKEKMFVNLHKYGNVSAASIIIALDEAIRTNVIKKGDLVGLTTAGGGLTWGAAIIKL